MDKVVEILKALSDTTRLRVLMAIECGEVCACQVTELLQLAPSTISKHMSILAHAGLIRRRKEGKWTFYNIQLDLNKNKDTNIGYVTIQRLKNDSNIVKDKARLKK